MHNIISTISNNPLISTIVGGIVSGIIILVISLLINRKKKVLSYKIISNNLLIKDSDNIKIFYSNKEINNIYEVKIEINNAGNNEIKPDDYGKNISIVFDESINILSAIIKEKYPDDLDIDLDIKDNKVLLDKILLNKNDRFIIQFELTSKINSSREKIENIQVSARIVGFKIKKKKPIYFLSFWSNIYYLIINCIGLFYFTQISQDNNLYFISYILFVLFLIELSYLIYTFYIYIVKRSKY